tara:strand:- start:573 stop:995 length:423 start_codon:yes stop_codon:yes gene_type:complete
METLYHKVSPRENKLGTIFSVYSKSKNVYVGEINIKVDSKNKTLYIFHWKANKYYGRKVFVYILNLLLDNNVIDCNFVLKGLVKPTNTKYENTKTRLVRIYKQMGFNLNNDNFFETKLYSIKTNLPHDIKCFKQKIIEIN